uniref:Lysosome membrane protein 2 n=1 Tax=Aceria tosichella TaxID=561515 RepID=A0A6G1SEZ7_9ACAR
MLWKYLCYGVGFIFGSLMLFGGAYVLHSMPSLFEHKIKANLPLIKGTDAYTRYTNSNVPLSVKLYMFNVTNPKEVAEQGAKPNLVQVGPFSFAERRRREIVSISPDNTTLDYKLFRSYFYLANESVPLDQIITAPNGPAFSAFFGAAEKERDEESAASPLKVVQEYLANETLYISHKAEDWLFNGINIKWMNALNDDGVFLEEQPPDNKFGLYYKKNNTWDKPADGIMTISTGADGDMANIGRVVRWNGKSTVSYWRGKTCNTVRGTDGQFFHPFVQKDEKLEIFAPDMCRTLQIEYIKTTSIRSIELYRFGISSNFFRPIDFNEETKCFCVKRSHEAKQKFCKLGGIIDLSSCRKKPVVLSTPHFFNGDPLLRQAVDGMAPSAANHDTFIDIEPMTGSVLRVRRRLQVNFEMVSHDGYTASNILGDKLLIHPFIWMDQSIVIPDELAQKLENKLTKIVRMVRILCYAALITGPIILIATLIFICRDIRTEDKKIRSAKKSSKKTTSSMNNGGDYQKVQVREGEDSEMVFTKPN